MTIPRSILSLVRTDGGAVVAGPGALIAARRTLQLAMDELRVAVVFHPASDPDLIDLLTITTMGALEGATLGAALGLAIGLLAGSPGTCAAAGAAIGGAAGAARGSRRVDQGWRVRAVRDGSGAPVIFISSGLRT